MLSFAFTLVARSLTVFIWNIYRKWTREWFHSAAQKLVPSSFWLVCYTPTMRWLEGAADRTERRTQDKMRLFLSKVPFKQSLLIKWTRLDKDWWHWQPVCMASFKHSPFKHQNHSILLKKKSLNRYRRWWGRGSRVCSVSSGGAE